MVTGRDSWSGLPLLKTFYRQKLAFPEITLHPFIPALQLLRTTDVTEGGFEGDKGQSRRVEGRERSREGEASCND